MQEAIEGATFAAFAQQRAALADQAAKRDAAAQFNTSGITPLDVRVLVRPDAVAEKVGGIFLPDSVKDQDKFAQQKATLIAVGANAWCEAKAGAGFVAPEPGARVLIGKYAGIRQKGDDGVEYLIMNASMSPPLWERYDGRDRRDRHRQRGSR